MEREHLCRELRQQHDRHDPTSTSGTTNAATETVVPGGTATYSLQFAPSKGTVFPAPVTLSLSCLPPGATGVLNPQTLPAASSLTNVTLTIQLPQQAAELHRNLKWTTPMLGLLFLPFAARMRRSGRTSHWAWLRVAPSFRR